MYVLYEDTIQSDGNLGLTLFCNEAFPNLSLINEIFSIVTPGPMSLPYLNFWVDRHEA